MSAGFFLNLVKDVLVLYLGQEVNRITRNSDDQNGPRDLYQGDAFLDTHILIGQYANHFTMGAAGVLAHKPLGKEKEES